jgi:hypothetical protein
MRRIGIFVILAGLLAGTPRAAASAPLRLAAAATTMQPERALFFSTLTGVALTLLIS